MDEGKRGFRPVGIDDGDINSLGESRMARRNFYLKIGLGVCTLVSIFFFVAFSVSAANTNNNPQRSGSSTGSVPCVSASCVETAARVIAAMNVTVSPCEDFYQYACGGWLANNPIPDDKPSYGSFSWLSDQNQAFERKLLSQNISTPTGKKASSLFLSCLDEDTIDSRGNQPILPLFQQVNESTFLNTSLDAVWNAPTDSLSLGEMLGMLHLKGVGGLFGTGVGPDDKNSSRNAMFIGQGGLSLPDRDYYFKNISTDRVLLAFKDYLSTSFQLVGILPQTADMFASNIIEFETKLANFTLPPDEMRDPIKLYNPKSVAQLNQEYPFIQWDTYFAQIYGTNEGVVKDTVVSTPDFFHSLAQLIIITPKTTMIQYLQAHVLSSYGSLLSKPFRDNRFRFRKALYGIQTNPDRWKTCVGMADSLGFAIGEAFVDQTFSKAARTAAEEILSDVTKAFSNSFGSLSWMDASTTVGARLKASQISQKIGYPEWYDTPNGVENYYNGLTSIGDQFFEGVVSVNQWQSKKDYLALFQPIDRNKWEMFPQEVNAYYHPSYNEIVFPAGILQPPFFSATAQKALNYGGVGAVMGHEISHAFDDQGAQYDGKGNLRQWWSNQSYDLFQNQTSCISKQYSKLFVDGPSGPVQINGDLTLGENIADNGGVRAAFSAYRSWVARNSPEPKLPGLDADPEKLFFLGYAQVWCQNARPDYARIAALSDPHSPARYRVNAVLQNSKDFASAFQCPIGSRMNPTEKCAVW